MQYRIVQRILGVLLMVFSLSMVPPILISAWYQDGAAMPFEIGSLIILSLGAVLWFPVRRVRQELRVREGFLVVSLFWVVLGLAGAVPFMLAEQPHMGFTDAVFESISGLTTTGATVITGLDTLPRSILFYRMELQWLGGMGIVVLAVAVLPMLGGGGMQLYRAESPGPVKDAKLTPRITETAKALWYIYAGLTAACALAYWGAGMGGFDALTHAFSTVAIGGFSNYDKSFAQFQSPLIEGIAMCFMLLAAINFALHFTVWHRKDLRLYLKDSECIAFLGMVGLVFFIACAVLLWEDHHGHVWTSIRHAAFQSISILTTTGFTTEDYALWPASAAMLLLLSSFMGGSAGSTSGGIKVIRFVLLIKQGLREINRLIHPSAQIPIRVAGKVVEVRVIEGIWGFFAVYVASFLIMYIGVAISGVELMSAFSGVAACMNNMGPGLSEVSTNYGHLNLTAKWILAFAMLLGRLEVFTLLVVLSPAYWRW